ncbi:MAG: hypothetical protein MZV65_02190 [Chromatiales bacterium]|nr:hypothetical protein [Chromatiales bacterium]
MPPLALACPGAPWHLSDIDQMQFSGNAYANELAGNGLMTFSPRFIATNWITNVSTPPCRPRRLRHILGELGVEREPLSHALNPDPDDNEAFNPKRDSVQAPASATSS